MKSSAVDSDGTFVAFAATRRAVLLRLAAGFTGDLATAEDIVQGVLARLFERWDRLAIETNDPLPYARRAVVNACIDRVRSAAHRREVVTADPPDLASHCPADSTPDQALLISLRRLPTRQRAVLVLRYLEDLSDPDIARAMDCSRLAVRLLAKRGLDRLRSDRSLTGLMEL